MSKVISNNEIKFIKSLSIKKFRDEEGVFVVEGEKMLDEAIASSFEVRKVYRESEIGPGMMSRISQLASPSPVLAVVSKPRDLSIDPGHCALPDRGLFLALDGIRDPGNLGTIIRIADWFGIDAVFASEDTVDLFNPKVVQSTMGAIFRVRFHYCDLPALCSRVKHSAGKVHGTFLDGEDLYSKPLASGGDCPAVIVIGNESNGISEKVAKQVTDRLYIPSWPRNVRGSESLNAAVATAVVVSEFRRRQAASGICVFRP